MTDELTSMVLGIARSAVVASTAGYEAGREQGFREGIKAAAELVEQVAEQYGPNRGYPEDVLVLTAIKIRGLKQT